MMLIQLILSLNVCYQHVWTKTQQQKNWIYCFQEPDDGRRHHYYHDKRKYVSKEVHETEVRSTIPPEDARFKPFTFHELCQPGVKGKILGTNPPKPVRDLHTKLPLSQPNQVPQQIILSVPSHVQQLFHSIHPPNMFYGPATLPVQNGHIIGNFVHYY